MRKALLVLLVLAVSAMLVWPHAPERGSVAGKAVFVVSPVATALYDNAGRPARDDEPLYGMTGNVIGEAGADGLWPVRMQYGYAVRVHGGDLLFRSLAPAAWLEEPTHVVSGEFADILPSPDLKAYPPLVTLPRGALLWSAGGENGYRRVVLHDGKTGYVRNILTRDVRRWADGDERINRERVASDALSYLGAPYRWGGKSPGGIDCSGLAFMAYWLNGLSLHRNSIPRAGYPVALMHIEPSAEGGYTRESLAGARKGDLLYWQGHQAVYLGDGKYIHANAGRYSVSMNSLFRGDPDFNADLANPAAVLTWGTAYPREPEALKVRRFLALPAGEPGRYRFYARLDGYAPTSAILHPEGIGEGRPVIVVDDPGDMVFGPVGGDGKNVPAHTYAGKGKFRPVIEFINADGWLPSGKPIAGGPVTMSTPVIVE